MLRAGAAEVQGPGLSGVKLCRPKFNWWFSQIGGTCRGEGQTERVAEAGVLPGQGHVVQLQVPHAVPCGAGGP